MRQFYIFCNGGFGNRFYSLLNGLFLSYHSGLEPKVIWPVNNWCRAGFHDCFDSELIAVDIDYQSMVDSGQTINILHNNFFNPNISWISATGSSLEQILQYIKSSQLDVFTGTDSLCYYVDRRTVIHGLMPVVPIHRTIQQQAQQIRTDLFNSNPYYGIHIRKTDAAHYVDESELERIINGHQHLNFFVCSDSKDTELYYSSKPNVKCNLKHDYVEKLVPGDWNTSTVDSQGSQFTMNVDRSKESVLQALQDILLLSYSDLQYNTSSMSSFLKVARLIQDTNE